ncbi:MAG: peptide chain release factor 2 [Candidatus Cloacimonetes bacterium]|nr:peptide chain release factor 2 [Candidatus Cloacimonadota bacterium]
MELVDFIKQSEGIIKRISEIRRLLDTADLKKKILNSETEMEKPDFWNDQRRATKITKELNQLKNQIVKDDRLATIKDDLETYVILLNEDFNESLLKEATEVLIEEKQLVDSTEVQFLLNGKTDSNSAILTIHPGAGGTESQDWAEMLFRMYNRWAEKTGHKIEIVDFQSGDEAGIKSVTMEIMGDYVYGYLKTESGVHRLVRISPFNAQGKRQTSFASVFVYPMIEDDIEVEIETSDLRIDTYRASGKGGQGVNTTDSAVRITHIPTNIIVQCQNERSQLRNREVAMVILKSKLYQHYEEEREKKRQKHEDKKTDIGWGNQIRSYVFHPYQMVKDHRTNYETGNISSVMDGDLDDFMNAFLKKLAGRKNSKMVKK